MAKAAKLKSEELKESVPTTPEAPTTPVEVLVEPEVVVDEVIEQPNYTVETTSETEPVLAIVEVAPEQKEIKESDEIGFLYAIMETMESGGWGKVLHPMIKSRIEYLRTK